MKVLILTSPFASLDARRTCEIAETAWASARCDDDLTVRPVSDGRPNDEGNSGLHEVIGGIEVPPGDVDYSLCSENSLHVARAKHTVHMWRSDSSALLDYTSIARLTEGDSTPRREISSDILGAELLWARNEGLREVIIALPPLSDISDLGRGMLSVLSGIPAPVTGEDETDFLNRAVATVRDTLGTLRLIILATDAQRLTGFSGVARAYTRFGLDPREAQELDGRIGDYAEALVHAYEQSLGRSLFLTEGETPSPRGDYAGAGSGLAFALQCVGASLYSVGDLTVRARFAEKINESDLLLYVSGPIEADLPSGLLSSLDIAQDDPPLVLVYDYGAIAKGELRQLGLAGAYELRPHLAFLDTATPTDSQESAVQNIEEILEQRIVSLAHTWGW